ncbi:MAG: hypothetical protein H6727_11975 [Myxococcales bacterium]|nr:hypothetical protein [Myxococcales bacterium]
MQLRCASCDQPIRSQNINPNQMIAKCGACHAVFRFSSEDLHDTKASKKKPSPRKRANKKKKAEDKARKLILPDKLQLKQDKDNLQIRWPWRDALAYFLFIFSILWNSVVWTMYPSFSTKSGPISFFPLIHVGLGIGLFYTAIVFFVNSSTVSVRDDRLQILYGPLPWLWYRNKTLATKDILQLSCEQQSGQENGTVVSYKLDAVLSTGTLFSLLTDLEEDHALFLKKTIEDHLNIEERAVRDEYEL